MLIFLHFQHIIPISHYHVGITGQGLATATVCGFKVQKSLKIVSTETHEYDSTE